MPRQKTSNYTASASDRTGIPVAIRNKKSWRPYSVTYSVRDSVSCNIYVFLRVWKGGRVSDSRQIQYVLLISHVYSYIWINKCVCILTSFWQPVSPWFAYPTRLVCSTLRKKCSVSKMTSLMGSCGDERKDMFKPTDCIFVPNRSYTSMLCSWF